MVRKKLNTDEIDEEFLLSTINNDKPASEQNKEAAIPEKTMQRKRLQKDEGYTSMFIQQSDSKARSGKLVPIRPEYHERILKIVRVIGNDEITIFNYIDNVLSHHFAEFQEEITLNYHEKNKDIF
jgi:hypothetical protein